MPPGTRGFPIFFFLGGLFPTPRNKEIDNFPPSSQVTLVTLVTLVNQATLLTHVTQVIHVTQVSMVILVTQVIVVTHLVSF